MKTCSVKNENTAEKDQFDNLVAAIRKKHYQKKRFEKFKSLIICGLCLYSAYMGFKVESIQSEQERRSSAVEKAENLL